MNAKKSFFNRTIFLQSIRLFWPVCILYLIFLFCFLGVSRYVIFGHGVYTTGGSDLFYMMLYSGHYQLFFNIIFAAVFAGISFRYIFFRKSSDTIHALPVSKICLFISNATSGLVMLMLPQIIYYIVLKITTNNLGLGKLSWEYWGFLLAMLGCSFFFYALALVCIMVSGHLVAFPVLYLLLNILATSISKILQLFLQLLAFGIDLSSFSFNLSFLSPRGYISEKMNLLLDYSSYSSTYPLYDSSQAMGFYLTVLGYVLVGIVLSLLSLLLYHKRKSEKCGTPIAFASLSYVVKIILPLYAALCITYLFYTSFNSSYVYYKPEDMLLLLVIFIASCGICSLLTEMLLCKSFRIPKKGLIGSATFTFIILICGFLIRFDTFGITSRLPDAANVKEISLESNSDIIISSVLSDPEIIQEVIDMNRQIIQEKDNIISECNKLGENQMLDVYSSTYSYYGGYRYNSKGYLYTVRINYHLKNGKTVSRTYTLPVYPDKLDNMNSYTTKLQGFISNPEYILAAMNQLEEKSDSFSSIELNAYEGTLLQMLETTPVSDDATYVYHVGENAYNNSYSIPGSNQKNIQKMYEAIKKDIKNGSLKPTQSLDFRDVKEYFEIGIYFNFPMEQGTYPISFIANKNCKNILAAYYDILTFHEEEDISEDEGISSIVAAEAKRLCETYGYHVSYFDYTDTFKTGAKIFTAIQDVSIQGGYPAISITGDIEIYRYNYKLKESYNGDVYLCILTNNMLGDGEYIYEGTTKDTELKEGIFKEADVYILGAYLYYSGDVTPIKAVSDTGQLTENTDYNQDLEVVP